MVVGGRGGTQWDTWSQGKYPKCSLKERSSQREVEIEFQVL